MPAACVCVLACGLGRRPGPAAWPAAWVYGLGLRPVRRGSAAQNCLSDGHPGAAVPQGRSGQTFRWAPAVLPCPGTSARAWVQCVLGRPCSGSGTPRLPQNVLTDVLLAGAPRLRRPAQCLLWWLAFSKAFGAANTLVNVGYPGRRRLRAARIKLARNAVAGSCMRGDQSEACSPAGLVA